MNLMKFDELAMNLRYLP